MSAQNQESLSFPVPIGVILPYAGVNVPIPKGFLLCDGSEIDIEEYPLLYSVLGDIWGASNPGTFRVPNLINQYLRGVETNTGISQPAILQGTLQYTLTENNLPIVPLDNAQPNLQLEATFPLEVVRDNVDVNGVSDGVSTITYVNEFARNPAIDRAVTTFNSMTLQNTTNTGTPIQVDISAFDNNVQMRGYGMAYIIRASNLY
jgi:hypothetical protein